MSKDLGYHLSTDSWNAARELISRAMQEGLVPKGLPFRSLVPDEPETWAEWAEDLWLPPEQGAPMADFCRHVLRQSIRLAFSGILSYDDQLYMPCVFDGIFPKFDFVLVDEAQDLSALNAIQVRRVASGRIVICGDQKQSIYQFRGADANSISNLRSLRSDWIDLPLATTFRCPKVVVERQQKYVPEFKAFITNPEGEFMLMPEAWHMPPGPCAVLCRVNAPLISLAFRLIRQDIGCHMLGRDIGKGLTALSKKILPADGMSAESCREAVEDWRVSQTAVARANGKEAKIMQIDDKADSLLAVLEAAETAGQLRAKLSTLFSRENTNVTLSTIHKAKGLEWSTVILLDPWRIPSRWAIKDGRPKVLEQEYNLKYVAETRTKQTLIHADLETFQ